jgi:hypothetical protein
MAAFRSICFRIFPLYPKDTGKEKGAEEETRNPGSPRKKTFGREENGR